MNTELHEILADINQIKLTKEIESFRIVQGLISVVWDYTFMYYYWVKKPDTESDQTSLS